MEWIGEKHGIGYTSVLLFVTILIQEQEEWLQRAVIGGWKWRTGEEQAGLATLLPICLWLVGEKAVPNTPTRSPSVTISLPPAPMPPNSQKKGVNIK